MNIDKDVIFQINIMSDGQAGISGNNEWFPDLINIFIPGGSVKAAIPFL
jgi:hypothetical protein